jgi:predicted transcriptional regulator
MHEDSQRLSDSARTLVRFLDTDPANTAATGTAQDEVDAWLARHEFTFPELESSDAAMDMLLNEDELSSDTARHIARGVLLRYVSDAKRVQLSELRAVLTGQAIDPVALGQHFQVEIPVIFRRLSALPEIGLGLAVCDRAGSLIFRKPAEGFALPKLAAACALWPIYDVFAQPSAVGRTHVKQQDRFFEVFVAGEEQAKIGYNRPSLYHALMLICPAAEHDDVLEVGSACRICARASCSGRREPTILAVNTP